MDTVQFLQKIFEYAETGYTQVFHLPSTSAIAVPVDNLPAAAGAIDYNQNAYFSPGVAAAPKSSKLKAEDVSGITALWADIDIYHPIAHAASNLPRTVAEAMELLPEMLPPSMVVHSGYGLQAWWLLKEVWIFDTPEERQQAEQLLRNLQGYIKAAAAQRQWHVDSVPDVSRVMRLPGTWNHKIAGQPVAAQVIEISDVQYDPSEVADVLPEVQQESGPRKERKTAFERRQTDKPAALMLQNCAFLQHGQLNAKTLPYAEWLAALSNIVRGVDGIEAAHQFSALDPARYNPKDTDDKIDECLSAMNPQTCEYIRSALGFKGCPADGCGVQAPCVWSLGRVPQAKALIRSITVPTPETVYQPEVLTAAAVLEKEAPAEYDIFWQRLNGQVNKNTFRKELAKHKREMSGFAVIDGGQADATPAAPTNPDAAKQLQQSVPDLPLELQLPTSGSNYSQWRFGPSGVGMLRVSDKGESFNQASYVPVVISQRIYNIDTSSEKAQVSFKTQFGSWRHVVLPKSTIFDAKKVMCLADAGLTLNTDMAKTLSKWLSALEAANAHVIPVKQGVSKMGWRDNETQFILPGLETKYTIDIGDSAAESTASGLGQGGDFRYWCQTMVELRKRIKARFMLAASFAAPLLQVLGQRSFLIYNWDTTRGGKTATLHAALSVWGRPEDTAKTFSDTKSNMERTAAIYTDLPLGINEFELLSERQKEEAQTIAYQIAEGKGRGRATREGLQRTVQWRTIALMNGESQFTRYNSRGGVFTRLIELRGGPLADDDIFASSLYSITSRNYGHAGKYFIEQLLRADHNQLRDTYNKTRIRLREKYPSKIESHLDAMACIALADFLASMWVFGAPEAAAMADAIQMAETIIAEITTKAEADESERAWEWLPDWLMANEARFMKYSMVGVKTAVPWLGYIEGATTNIIKSELEKALRMEGFNSGKVLTAWADAGRIACTENKSTGRRQFGIRGKVMNGSRPWFISMVREDGEGLFQ